MLLHLFSHSYYWLNRFARRFFSFFLFRLFLSLRSLVSGCHQAESGSGWFPQIGKVKLTESLLRQYFFRRSAH